MARTGAGNLLCKRNSKLDSFLKRNTDRGVYERIRAYEPCVVISETVNKVFMHVVLSDDCVYLAEYPPRTLTVAVNFSHIREIELVNDLPDFLSGRDRERSQHIRVVYATEKHSGKRHGWMRGKEPGEFQPSPAPPTHRHSLAVSPSLSRNHFLASRVGGVVLSAHAPPPGTDVCELPPIQRRNNEVEEEEEERLPMLRINRSASCPDPQTLGLHVAPPRPLPQPPSPALSLPSPHSPLSPEPPPPAGRSEPAPLPRRRRRGSVLARLMKKGRAPGGERNEEGEGGREAELHLYSVSPTSRIYLHLQSSWSSYIIRSTLLLDPLYSKRCSASANSTPQIQPTISWERTAHLFRQLSGELLQEGLSLESRYLLLQELCTAAHRNTTLRKLFWRSSDLCPFLVRTLEESLRSCQAPDANRRGGHTADQLLLCTLIIQTMALMFRETEIEPARLNMLTAKQGALPARLLLAMVCEPLLPPQEPALSPPDLRQDPPTHTKLQGLLAEYLDAACSLLFELVVLCQEESAAASRTLRCLEHFLTVGWILKVLQPHPALRSFMGFQAQQVVLVLSGPQAPLSPAQAALVYQRCRVLLACLQYSSPLGLYLRTEYREEFRYYVKVSCLEEKLPSHYPISQPARRLVSQLLGLILQN
ncbi:uncharacterized protein C12orf56 homolog [Osmerus mordax]|uniref:uncharacterized protein C12orf56 homolog n=1 Tax=Osmerus mordax TaxID=8014 RepID=UPI00350FBBC6